MFKKSCKKIAALALVFILGAGSPAFAKTITIPNKNTNAEKSMTMIKGDFKEQGFEKLISDLDLTKEDLDKARNSSKTIFDLAKKKNNLSADEVREMLIKIDTENINKELDEGKLTKEKADEIISNMKTRIQNWDGKLK